MSHQQRLLAASSWDFFLLPEGPETKKTKEAAQIYSKTKIKVGPPHVHIFMAFLEALAENDKVDLEAKAAFKAAVHILGEGGPEEVAEIVQHFTCKPAFKKEGEEQTMKLSWSFQPLAISPLLQETIGRHAETLTTAGLEVERIPRMTVPRFRQILIEQSVQHLKAKKAMGAAPPSESERLVRRQLQRSEE